MSDESEATIRIEEGATSVELILTGTVGSYHSDELYFACLTARERNRPVTVDCAAVERLGGTTVQLLLALSRALTATGTRLQLRAVPAAVADHLRSAGLAALLGGGAP